MGLWFRLFYCSSRCSSYIVSERDNNDCFIRVFTALLYDFATRHGPKSWGGWNFPHVYQITLNADLCRLSINGKGVILATIFSFAILKSPCCSSDNSNHDANASPSSKVGSLSALILSFYPIAFAQMSNHTNHSEIFLLEKELGKLMCFACASYKNPLLPI